MFRTANNGNNKKLPWLHEGYKQFAEYGPKQLSVNNLSKALDASRASFYHFFGDIDVFVEELCAMHWDIVMDFNSIGKAKITRLFPDFYVFLSEYKIPLQFALQLFRNRHVPAFNFLFLKTYESSAHAFVLELFKEECNLRQPKHDLLQLWITVGEAWYSRLDPTDLSAETMQKHSQEILETVMRFSNSRLYSTIRID